jgi:hypothetical protein
MQNPSTAFAIDLSKVRGFPANTDKKSARWAWNDRCPRLIAEVFKQLTGQAMAPERPASQIAKNHAFSSILRQRNVAHYGLQTLDITRHDVVHD